MGEVWDDEERAALVALLRARPGKRTWPELLADVDAESSALAVWRDARPPTLDEDADLAAARADIAQWQAAGLGFLTFLDDTYPSQLRAIHDLPPVLFHRGALAPGEAGVSVVGSRNASPLGLRTARALAEGLVDRGITVIAGLARGVDTAAHVAALEAGGRTVAVLGTGISRYYPEENRALQDRVAADGLLLSQFWPDAPPTRSSFPMRNTVMSGYGRATIVVEAGEVSGARIQARRAVAHGRPVVLTDLVVAANTWAQKLVGAPGVHVADTAAEAMTIIEGILDGPAETDALLGLAPDALAAAWA